MATNPYSSVSVSSYNASPPPDDGSQTTANKVTWAGIKTKLTDPLNTFASAVNSAISAAFGSLIVTTTVSEESLIVFARNVRN